MAGQRRIDRDGLARMIADGLSTVVIAKRFGVQSPAVCRACHAFGLPLPGVRRATPDVLKREPTRKDDERDLAILRLRASVVTLCETARRLGISNKTVQSVHNAVVAADIAESGEPASVVARAYGDGRRGGWRQ
jgi:DNA-binding CsgD family transcriptional regulator